MVEFLRLKIIIGDDLSGALRTWQTDMEVATDKFLRDLDAATQTSTTLPSKNAAVGVALRQFRAATQLRVTLPLTQLDEAREEMETFIQSRLEELRSLQETKNLIGELSSRVTDHRGRVRELLRSEPLRHPEVVPLVMVGLAADRPIESNFFPGLLEGLLQTAFYWFFAVSGPFTSFLVLHTVSWFSRSEVCAFVWGIFVRGLRVETFVRVLRSSRVIL